MNVFMYTPITSVIEVPWRVLRFYSFQAWTKWCESCFLCSIFFERKTHVCFYVEKLSRKKEMTSNKLAPCFCRISNFYLDVVSRIKEIVWNTSTFSFCVSIKIILSRIWKMWDMHLNIYFGIPTKTYCLAIGT